MEKSCRLIHEACMYSNVASDKYLQYWAWVARYRTRHNKFPLCSVQQNMTPISDAMHNIMQNFLA